MNRFLVCLLSIHFGSGSGTAIAANLSDPFDAAAPVLSVPYRSSFADYRLLSEPQVGDWREANRVVNQRGGWKAYAKEAGDPETPSAVISSPAAEAENTVKPSLNHDLHNPQSKRQ